MTILFLFDLQAPWNLQWEILPEHKIQIVSFKKSFQTFIYLYKSQRREIYQNR